VFIKTMALRMLISQLPAMTKDRELPLAKLEFEFTLASPFRFLPTVSFATAVIVGAAAVTNSASNLVFVSPTPPTKPSPRTGLLRRLRTATLPALFAL